MGFKSIAVDSVTPVFDTLMKQGAFVSNEFSFYLSSTPGDDYSALVLGTHLMRWNYHYCILMLCYVIELMPLSLSLVGGTDTQYHNGDFSYIPLTQENYWLIKVDDILIGGETMNTCNYLGYSSACLTIVDTGTVQRVICLGCP